jgi:CRISPR/Cas system-associated exonuclease Cas4 (RecB family)/predicted Rdx family selenoprotein
MECRRKYAYTYYASHNGWLHDAPADSKYAYRLKKLITLPMLFGQAVHDVTDHTINQYRKSGCIPGEKELEQRVRTRLRTAFLDSRDRGEQWFRHPNRYKMLFDMYYEGRLAEPEIQDIHHRLDTCLRNFLHSKSFREMTSSRNISIAASEKFPWMVIDGMKVYGAMDVIYQHLNNGRWVIVDWKTGQHTADDVSQLAVYALYAMEKWDIPLEKIAVRNEYLLTGSSHTYYLTADDITAMTEQMKESVQAMKLYQQDSTLNKPVPLEQFQRTSQTFRCQRCNFKEICLESYD